MISVAVIRKEATTEETIHGDHNKEIKTVTLNKTVDHSNNKEGHSNKIADHSRDREIKTADLNKTADHSNKIVDRNKDQEIKIVGRNKTADHNNNKDNKGLDRHKEIKILQPRKIPHQQNQKTNSIVSKKPLKFQRLLLTCFCPSGTPP